VINQLQLINIIIIIIIVIKRKMDISSVEIQLLVSLIRFNYMFRFQSIHHQALYKTNTRYNVITCHYIYIFFPPGATQPIVGVYFTALYRALASSRTRLLDHT
jgi:hypothetical protein